MKPSAHRIRHMCLQAARRLVQMSVVLLILVLPYLSLYAHYRAAHALEDETEMVGFRGRVLAALDKRISAMDDPQRFLDDNKGTLWSVRLGGWDLTDPLAVEAMAASLRRGSVPGSLVLSMLVPVLTTLVLGKVFCSWICPANPLFELAGKLRKLLRLAELPPAEVRFSRANKYVFLGVGLLAAAIVGLPIFTLLYPPAALSRMAHAWIFGTSLAGFLVLLAGIATVEVILSPRWWCRSMCPGGALYGLIGWPRLLRVKLDENRCTKCRRCELVCEPGLDPVAESYGIECDNCGQCVKACPEKALRYSVGFPAVRGKGTRRAAVVAVLLAWVWLVPQAASAHHILGLPHYSYKENYPQVPVLEYPATTGPYDVLFVCYPGKPSPGEPANLVFDIKNRSTRERFEQPITVRVLQTFTFGNNREILPATDVPAFDVLHKLSATFPEDGEYVVELTMDVEGRPETIGFLMIAGNPSATTSVLIAVGGGLAVFLITVRAIKKKRDRRKRQNLGGAERP